VGPISVSTHIDAPREHVFDFLCDLANRPTFTDHVIDDFRLERLESVGVGAAARFRLRELGVWMETQIVEVDRPYRISERGRGGRANRIPVVFVWELRPRPGPGGCEVTLHFWTEPSHHLDRLRERLGAERWYRLHWTGALARLKQVIESSARVAPVGVAGGARLPVT